MPGDQRAPQRSAAGDRPKPTSTFARSARPDPFAPRPELSTRLNARPAIPPRSSLRSGAGPAVASTSPAPTRTGESETIPAASSGACALPYWERLSQVPTTASAAKARGGAARGRRSQAPRPQSCDVNALLSTAAAGDAGAHRSAVPQPRAAVRRTRANTIDSISRIPRPAAVRPPSRGPRTVLEEAEEAEDEVAELPGCFPAQRGGRGACPRGASRRDPAEAEPVAGPSNPRNRVAIPEVAGGEFESPSRGGVAVPPQAGENGPKRAKGKGRAVDSLRSDSFALGTPARPGLSTPSSATQSLRSGSAAGRSSMPPATRRPSSATQYSSRPLSRVESPAGDLLMNRSEGRQALLHDADVLAASYVAVLPKREFFEETIAGGQERVAEPARRRHRAATNLPAPEKAEKESLLRVALGAIRKFTGHGKKGGEASRPRRGSLDSQLARPEYVARRQRPSSMLLSGHANPLGSHASSSAGFVQRPDSPSVFRNWFTRKARKAPSLPAHAEDADDEEDDMFYSESVYNERFPPAPAAAPKETVDGRHELAATDGDGNLPARGSKETCRMWNREGADWVKQDRWDGERRASE